MAPPKDISIAKAEVERCIVGLILDEPYFGHLLASVARDYTDRTPTAAVALTTNGLQLWINTAFFMETIKTQEMRTAIIKHEALHLVFKHLTRFDTKIQNHLLFNLAADLVVNQFVAPWPLPESAITLKTFPDMDLKPDQTVEWYYEKLVGLQSEMSTPSPNSSHGSPQRQSGVGADDADGADDDQGTAGGTGPAGADSGSAGTTDDAGGSDTDSKAEAGSGTGGSKMNEGDAPLDQEKNHASGRGDYSHTSAPKSAAALDRLMGSKWHSDHDGWASSKGGQTQEEGYGGSVPAGLRDAFEAELEEHLIRTKNRAGSRAWSALPGPIRDLVEAYLEKRKPRIDWRRVLRLFSNSSRRTRIITTSRKMSKRYGTFPGIKVKRYQRVAVAIDTSGSVDDNLLSLFFSEIHGMWRQGAEVDVIECDAAVQRTYPYRGQLPESVAGRGGTDFNPVFTWLRERRHIKYDACIYLTDGYAAIPQVKPPCRLLWIITPDGTSERLPFGRQVKIESST